MINDRFKIEVIKSSELSTFFQTYKPNIDYPKLQEIFSGTLELCYNQDDVSFTNVIHVCFDIKEQKYCALLNIGTTTDIDDIASIDIEFLFVEKEYRKIHFEELGNIKLSEYLLIDYVVLTIGETIKNQIGINTVALTPATDKIRELYSSYRFQTIQGSGSKEAEDWMVFNL